MPGLTLSLVHNLPSITIPRKASLFLPAPHSLATTEGSSCPCPRQAVQPQAWHMGSPCKY